MRRDLTLCGIIVALLAALGVWRCARAQVPLPPQDQLFSATCAVPCTTAVVPTSGYAQVSVRATGTGAGLAFKVEASNDNGANWATLPAVVPAVPGTWVTAMAANGIWVVPAASFQRVRVNLTAIISGSETFSLAASTQTNLSIGQ